MTITDQIIYDVAVIGAGPAGAVFAKELAKATQSKKILVIHKAQPKVCGGLLSPDAQKILARLDLTLPKSILADPQVFTVETIDLSYKHTRFYPRHYLNMDRTAFDSWLLSLALAQKNVDIYEGNCFAIKKSSELIIIKVKNKDKESAFYTRTLVGADGASSIVRKTFFSDRMYRYTAIQQWFAAPNKNIHPYSCIFDKETTPSCSWTIKKEGIFIYGGAFPSNKCKRSFDEQKKRFEKKASYSLGTPMKTEACLLSSPQKSSDFLTCKGNVFLIGEAAGFISASSFEGISYALLSAKILADAFVNGKDNCIIRKIYKRKTLFLRLKLSLKILKKHILYSPFLRRIIMLIGIGSIKKYNNI